MAIQDKIKIIPVTAALIFALALSGCSFLNSRNAPELPDYAPSFEKKDSDSSDMMYITYNDRTYMPFGTIGKGISYGDTLRDCLGYIDDDRNTRVYSLLQDPYDNYLMIRNVTGFMEQPEFWRASDTYKQDIFTPDYIQSLDYEEWTGSGTHSEMSSVRIHIRTDAEDVKMLSTEYTVNGKPGGGCDSGYTNGAVLEKGHDTIFEITEVDLDGKVNDGDPFDLNMILVITDSKGGTYKAEGEISGNVRLQDELFYVLTGDPDNGYRISGD